MARAGETAKRPDLTIQPFGPGTENVRITEMTGRQLEAALRYYPSGGGWGDFLRIVLWSFRMAGGMATERVASRVNLTPKGLAALVRNTPATGDASGATK
jgi:hypothetical protein